MQTRKLQLPGFEDKRYWRKSLFGRCCFKRNQFGTYTSLCGGVTMKNSGGQKMNRPPPVMRCGMCDGAEIERMGKEESLPDSPDFDPSF